MRGNPAQDYQLCGAPAGCHRRVFRQGLCAGHVKRKQRRLPVDVDLAEKNRTRQQVLAQAALHYAGVEGDAEYHRAWDRLRKAAVRYGQAE